MSNEFRKISELPPIIDVKKCLNDWLI